MVDVLREGLTQKDTSQVKPVITIIQWPRNFAEPLSPWEAALMEERGTVAPIPSVPWAVGKIVSIAELIATKSYLG